VFNEFCEGPAIREVDVLLVQGCLIAEINPPAVAQHYRLMRGATSAQKLGAAGSLRDIGCGLESAC
jgi:hypothetical protein